MLFSLYLNDLETFFNYHNARGVECEINNEQLLLYLKLFVILYADDTVLLSDTSKDLQKQLNLFEEYCKQWKLTVNTDKTKIVIFGSRVANDQTLYIFNNKQLEIVNEYKYLGIYLSKTGSYLKAKQHIAQQATKAMFMLMKKIRVLNLSYDIQIELFNKTIRPILLYGSELWGFTNSNILEKVQLKFMKQILYLKQSTPSYMIYGELGILPLREEAKIRMVSYWCRLTVNGINKLSNYLYSFIETLHKQRKIKSKWLEYIKAAILNNGFQNIWDNQNNFNNKWFQLAFKRRVKDSYLQTWNEQLNNSSSSITYKIIKHNFGINKYFTILPNYQCRLLSEQETTVYQLKWAGGTIFQ
jgi:hypothetical protein